ncbi:MAG: DUF3653 domain-containing protein [Marinobacter sp.]|nr:DUF3653 domain-containing protein [Marinobacter sp.]
MKKRSKAGRPKTKFFQLKLVTGGLDTWVQLEPARVAALVGVSVQTVYHWINGTKTPAPTTLALLEIVAGGLLPWRGWHGWRLSPETGRLIAPNGYSFQPGELAWWSLQKQLIRELERDNAGLRLQLEILRAQVNEQAANNLLPFTKAKKYRG